MRLLKLASASSTPCSSEPALASAPNPVEPAAPPPDQHCPCDNQSVTLAPVPRPSAYTLSPEACDLSSAAWRHVRDARTLLASSPDGAFYLAGYGPEIARKATISTRWLDQVIGHLNSAGQTAKVAVDLALDSDPIAHRYAAFDLSIHENLRQWETNARYQRTGTHSPHQAEAILREAAQITDELLAILWAEGRFPDKATPW